MALWLYTNFTRVKSGKASTWLYPDVLWRRTELNFFGEIDEEVFVHTLLVAFSRSGVGLLYLGNGLTNLQALRQR